MYARAVARGSTRRNRPAIRAMAWSNNARHRIGSTLWLTATARSSGVHTTPDDHAVAALAPGRVLGSAELLAAIRRLPLIDTMST